VCRDSQVAAGAAFVGPDLKGDEAAACCEAIAQSLRDARQVVELPVVRRREFLAALSRALATVLDNEAAPDEGLKTAARSWKRLVGEIGQSRLRTGYRAALGLSTAGERR
jgi:hypothetical protein